MALVSDMRAPSSERTAAWDLPRSELVLSLLWASFLTLLIAGPWLLPGYLFGTDWPGPRHFGLSNSIGSSIPLEAAMAGLGWAVGGELAGKLLILGSLFGAAFLAYRAVPAGGAVPRAAAATVYVVNPFVYGRLHYGQIFLLVAYAILPWTLTRLRGMLVDPGRRSSIGVAIAFVLVGVASPHMVLIMSLLAAVLFAAYTVTQTEKREYLKTSGPWIAVAIAVAAIASSYWVVPLIAGRGYESEVLATTGSGQLNAYAVVSDRSLGLLPNLLGLYGFWAEATGRFTSMKEFAPFWPLVLVAILALVAVGIATALRQSDRHLAPLVGGLLVAAAIAVVLEMGISHPVTAGVVRWLDANFVVYRGLRDAGKWAALLALVYSQLFGIGVATLLGLIPTHMNARTSRDLAIGVATGLLLAMPLYYGNGLLFGAHGEIKPSQYPAGWYAADRLLASDAHPGRALMLPWHEYMSYGFIQNQNKIVAPPAPTFFSVPVLVSSDPEVQGISPPGDTDQVAISRLVAAGDKGQWVQVLTAHGIKYLLLTHDLEWRSYAYLDFQAGLVKIADFGSIEVYRNSLSP